MVDSEVFARRIKQVHAHQSNHYDFHNLGQRVYEPYHSILSAKRSNMFHQCRQH